MRTVRRALLVASITALALVTFTTAAGAQQIVDAGKEGDGSGGLAFVLLALLVMLMWAALFFMDRIRRRRQDNEPAAH